MITDPEIDAMRTKAEGPELPFRRVVVGRMEDFGEYRKYWHVESNDGEATVCLAATRDDAEYIAALINRHGDILEATKRILAKHGIL